MFGKPTLEDRRPQTLAPVVDRALKLVQEQAQLKNVAIRMSTEDTCEADIDAPQIEQVLINLLLNAIDASPAGETVSVSAATVNGSSRVTITNTGPEMPEETKAHLFDAYFTTKPNGTGLGLSVSREIVVNHGGSLEFDSEDGRTSFWMDLPIGKKRTA
jgi:signal transduction histidine kinase